MSHELRTPLNSLLVLAEQLEDNPDGNLTERQVQYAQRHPLLGRRPAQAAQRHPRPGQGRVEHGPPRDRATLSLADLRDSMVQTFRPIAEEQGLAFSVELDDAAAGDDDHRSRTGCARCSRTCSPTRSSSPSTARSSLRHASRAHEAAGRSPISVTRHRDRHQAGAAQGDVRGLRAGRRHRPPASTAAPGSGSRSAATSSICSAGRSRWRASPGAAARSPSASRCSAGRRSRSERRPTAQPRVDASPPHRDPRAPSPQSRRQFYDGAAAGTTVLVVDDDFRNIFALTALLERGQAERRRGRERRGGARDPRRAHRHRPRADGHHDAGDERLRDDGRDPRAVPRCADLPIIAVTGKVGERRARALPRGRRVRLHPQAGRHGRAAGEPAAAGSPPRRRPRWRSLDGRDGPRSAGRDPGRRRQPRQAALDRLGPRAARPRDRRGRLGRGRAARGDARRRSR